MNKIENILKQRYLTDKDVLELEKAGYEIVTKPDECLYTVLGSPYIAHIMKDGIEIATSRL